jgi:hypothetical protein
MPDLHRGWDFKAANYTKKKKGTWEVIQFFKCQVFGEKCTTFL